jgi:hypothetical protein
MVSHSDMLNLGEIEYQGKMNFWDFTDHVETQDARMVSSGARAFTAAHENGHWDN